MNVLIAQKENEDKSRIKKILKKINSKIKIFEASTIKESYLLCKKIKMDFFILETQLKDGSGIDFAIELRKKTIYQMSFIIFISEEVSNMMSAFKKVHCYDYIIKPYKIYNLERLFQKIIFYLEKIKIQQEIDYLVIEKEGIPFLKIDLESILFLEVQSRNCIIHTLSKVYELKRYPLARVLKKIDCPFFMKTHRAFVVNLQKINKIEKLSNKCFEIQFKNYNKCAYLSYNHKEEIFDLLKKN